MTSNNSSIATIDERLDTCFVVDYFAALVVTAICLMSYCIPHLRLPRISTVIALFVVVLFGMNHGYLIVMHSTDDTMQYKEQVRWALPVLALVLVGIVSCLLQLGLWVGLAAVSWMAFRHLGDIWSIAVGLVLSIVVWFALVKSKWAVWLQTVVVSLLLSASLVLLLHSLAVQGAAFQEHLQISEFKRRPDFQRQPDINILLVCNIHDHSLTSTMDVHRTVLWVSLAVLAWFLRLLVHLTVLPDESSRMWGFVSGTKSKHAACKDMCRGTWCDEMCSFEVLEEDQTELVPVSASRARPIVFGGPPPSAVHM